MCQRHRVLGCILALEESLHLIVIFFGCQAVEGVLQEAGEHRRPLWQELTYPNEDLHPKVVDEAVVQLNKADVSTAIGVVSGRGRTAS